MDEISAGVFSKLYSEIIDININNIGEFINCAHNPIVELFSGEAPLFYMFDMMLT
jgi:hypothetical protein